MKKVTARDIARQVGVSTATVSLALRGKAGVSEQVKERILRTAQEIGYVFPSPSSGSIQLVIFKRHGKIVSSSPFMEILMQGVIDEAACQGLHLSVFYFYRDKNSAEQLKSITSLKSDGIILLATEMSNADLELFSGLTIPLTLLDNYAPSMRWDAVMIDNRCGVLNAVKHLIDQGHCRIGYLHSNVDFRNIRERKSGYLTACELLSENDAKEAARRIVKVDVITEYAEKMMSEYLASDPVLPSAFFADNDHIAAGCMRAIKAAGYRIPEDVSVIGFDDSPIAEIVEPKLTTMAVPKTEMGALAVRTLIRRIQEPLSPVTRTLIAPQLTKRASVVRLA